MDLNEYQIGKFDCSGIDFEIRTTSLPKRFYMRCYLYILC